MSTIGAGTLISAFLDAGIHGNVPTCHRASAGGAKAYDIGSHGPEEHERGLPPVLRDKVEWF